MCKKQEKWGSNTNTIEISQVVQQNNTDYKRNEKCIKDYAF